MCVCIQYLYTAYLEIKVDSLLPFSGEKKKGVTSSTEKPIKTSNDIFFYIRLCYIISIDIKGQSRQSHG